MFRRAFAVGLTAWATQTVTYGARALVDGVVGGGALTDATLVCAALWGVAGGALLGLRPRRALVGLVLMSGILAIGVGVVDDVSASVLGLPRPMRVLATAVFLAALSAPLGALVGRSSSPLRRCAYIADLVGSAVGVISAAVAGGIFGFATLAGVAALVTAVAAFSLGDDAPSPALESAEGPPSNGSKVLGAIVVMAAAVGVVEACLPALLAPATAGVSFTLTAVVVGAMVGGALGSTFAPRSLGGVMIGAAAVIVAGAALAEPWREGLLRVLGDPHASLLGRAVVATLVVAAVPAAAAAASANVLVRQLDARSIAVSAAVAGAAALTAPLLLQAWPEQVLAAVATVVAVAAVLVADVARPVIAAIAAGVVAVGVAVVAAPPVGDGQHDLSARLAQGGQVAQPSAAMILLDERDASGRSVVAIDEDITLYRDGKADASALGDVETQAMLGLLPLLYAPQANEAIVVGLGSGATARWLADAGVDVTALEISPQVLAAASRFGEGPLPENVRVVLGDARASLLSIAEADVVSVESSNLFVGGNARLVTVQALRAMQAKARSGVVVVWSHFYLANSETIQIVARTMSEVFPAIDLYASSSSDLFFVGRPLDSRPQPHGLQTRLGSRLGCALGAVDADHVEDLSRRGVAVNVDDDVAVHDDRRPALALPALLALFRADRAPIDVAEPPASNLITPRRVLTLLRSPKGRAELRERSSELIVDVDAVSPPWAPPLSEAGLALLGERVKGDLVIRGLQNLSAPRCFSREVRGVALEIARLSAARDPTLQGEVDAVVARWPTSRPSPHVGAKATR